MAEICEKCGLPKDLCICSEIEKGEQRIRIRLERRKWNRPVTVSEGLDSKTMDITKIAAELKSHCACGGTAKNNQILLQGDHRDKARSILIKLGFPEANIEIR